MSKKLKEGRRIKTLPPMQYVSVYIMKTRTGSTNYIPGKLDISAAEEYIKEKRAQGMTDFGMMHIFLAALVRMYARHPEMNRFIRGRRIYARNGIQISLAVKKELKRSAPDTVVKFDFKPEYTAKDVYEIVNAAVLAAKTEVSDFDDVAKTLSRMPRSVLRFAMWCLECLDYFGKIPKSLVKVSPFHGSSFITSMASLGIPPIYHHLYEFGNVSIFFAFGRKYHEYELQNDGSVRKAKYMDYRITCDERIADGHAYSLALRYFHSLIRDPYQLDDPPETVFEDVP